MMTFDHAITYSNDPTLRAMEKAWVETVLQLDGQDPELFDKLGDLGFHRAPPGVKMVDEIAIRNDWPGFEFELLDDRVRLYSDIEFEVEMLGNFVSAFLRRFGSEKEVWTCTYATVARPRYNGGGALVVTSKTWRHRWVVDLVLDMQKDLGVEGPVWLIR